jgi:two-component system response regulator YesN
MCGEDIRPPETEPLLEPDYCAIERSLQSADLKKSLSLLDDFFGEIERVKLDPVLAKTYCLELYVCVIRCCEAERIDKYMKGIMKFQALKTLDEIRSYINNIAEEIVALNRPELKRRYSALISDTLALIDENIGNENLSLRWLAGSILYTNVDYLGKLFKKEVGENFSHYVMHKRMEMAKQLIIGGEKDKIYEVAEKVGFGSNSQYFSQVFKKYTGVSPLEYKEVQKKRA